VLVMTFSTYARRSSPLNYNLLALFTFGEAISVGFVTSFYKFHSVVTAMLATALATTAISVYTVRQKNPKYDLTQWGAALSS
jgi:FtsH-binding integral membrane protein